MFLRFNRRLKDGKEHRYWNIVENKRCGGGKVVQRPRLIPLTQVRLYVVGAARGAGWRFCEDCLA